MPSAAPLAALLFTPSRASRFSLVSALCAAVLAGLTGCASPSSGGLVDKTLEMVGIKATDVPEETKALAVPQPKKLSLRVHAGEQLNTDTQKHSLSLVVKIYKLRSANAFLAAPYKSFGSPDTERIAFGSDVVEVRELVLTPGQRHEVMETMPTDATHLAVVALFRAPAEGRWRFAFNVKDAEKTGVTVGLHGCAMSVAAGMPEATPPEALRVAGVQCQ